MGLGGPCVILEADSQFADNGTCNPDQIIPLSMNPQISIITEGGDSSMGETVELTRPHDPEAAAKAAAEDDARQQAAQAEQVAQQQEKQDDPPKVDPDPPTPPAPTTTPPATE